MMTGAVAGKIFFGERGEGKALMGERLVTDKRQRRYTVLESLSRQAVRLVGEAAGQRYGEIKIMSLIVPRLMPSNKGRGPLPKNKRKRALMKYQLTAAREYAKANERWRYGTLGAASPVRRIDPASYKPSGDAA